MAKRHPVFSFILLIAICTFSLPGRTQTEDEGEGTGEPPGGVPAPVEGTGPTETETTEDESLPATGEEQPKPTAPTVILPPGGTQTGTEAVPPAAVTPPPTGGSGAAPVTDPELAGAPAVQADMYANMKRFFGFGLTFLNEMGYGGLIRGKFGYVGVEGFGGFFPVLYMVTGDCNEFGFRPAYHVGGSLLIFFKKQPKKFTNGLKLSGFYNPVMGPGGRIGWVGELRVVKTNFFAVNFSAGLSITPKRGEDFKKWLDDVCPAGITTYMEYFNYVLISFGITLMFYVV